MQERPKIFCQFVDLPEISPTSGDKINEIRFYRALSKFADIYYNDYLVDWSTGKIGAPGNLNLPSRDYDLYYVRANHELLKKLPHPKITIAYPYDPHSFETADAILVTTQAWAELLKAYNTSPTIQEKLKKWYPRSIVEPNQLINIGQTIDPSFIIEPTPREAFRWTARTTGSQVFGFFGRVTDETIPHDLMSALEFVRNSLDSDLEPFAVFAGSIRTEVPRMSLNLGQIEYANMPLLIRACTGTLGQSCKDSDYLGSGKILDSMACGVPIVCKANAVRIEQLGDDYPGMFETQDQANEIMLNVSTDPSFATILSEYLTDRRNHFLPDSSGGRISAALHEANLL